MRIGNSYADNKIYRGIRHSNDLPLIAEDLHEFSDTLSAKNNYLLENILGSGLLNKVTPILSREGIKLESPVVLNIEGDICLLNNSEDSYLVESSRVSEISSDKATIFVIGWYQNITANDTIKEYGGRMNRSIPNNLLYEPLGVQVSSRYQFIWDTAIYEGELPEGEFSLKLPLRDTDTGSITNTSYIVKSSTKVGSVYKSEPPREMSYVVDTLYLIPLLEYEYDRENQSIRTITSYPTRKTSSSMTMIESTTEPVGLFDTGTVWYNPNNREFKTYIKDTGFVANASKIGYIQYQYVNIAAIDTLNARDLSYEIEVPDLSEGDIFHVTYEGLELLEGTDYQIDISSKIITLLNFTRMKGEKLVVTVNRLVEVNDVTSITSLLISHVDKKSTSNDIGHVKLSDSTDSDSDSTGGLAATPKAVKDSKILLDTVTGETYRFIVENNTLYIENTSTNTRKNIINLSE